MSPGYLAIGYAILNPSHVPSFFSTSVGFWKYQPHFFFDVPMADRSFCQCLSWVKSVEDLKDSTSYNIGKVCWRLEGFNLLYYLVLPIFFFWWISFSPPHPPLPSFLCLRSTRLMGVDFSKKNPNINRERIVCFCSLAFIWPLELETLSCLASLYFHFTSFSSGNLFWEPMSCYLARNSVRPLIL